MRAVKTKYNYVFMTVKCTAELFPQSYQLQTQVTLLNLGRCQKRGVDSNSRARRLACFYNEGGQCACICLLILQLHYCDWGRTVRFVRLALKVVMLNNGEFVEVILLLKECVQLDTAS
jgi:hypothetical protein